eukprot:gene6797-13765_t
MERESFISEIIGELTRQQSNNTFNEINTVASPSEIHRKLCYDYPIVTGPEIKILVQAIATSPASFFTCGIVQKKFLENIVYYSSSNENSKFFGELCAAEFVSFPDRLLLCNRQELSLLLDDSLPPGLENENTTEHISATLQWTEILNRFKSICLMSTISTMADVDVNILSTSSFLDSIFNILTIFHPKSSQKIQFQHQPGTLRDIIELIKSDEELNSTIFDSLQVDKEKLLIDFKEIWIHLCFLVRDLFIQFPSLIPSFLSNIIQIILHNKDTTKRITATSPPTPHSQSNSNSYGSKSFPNESECIFILIISNISESILPSSKQFLYNLNNRSNILNLQSSLSSYMSCIGDIIERMLKYGNAIETSHFIVNLMNLFTRNISASGSASASGTGCQQLYIPIPKTTAAVTSMSSSSSTTTGNMYDNLISSRLLACLVHTYVLIVRTNNVSNETVRPPIPPLNEVDVEVEDGTIPKETVSDSKKFGTEVKRLEGTLANISMISEMASTFIFRYPEFISSLKDADVEKTAMEFNKSFESGFIGIMRTPEETQIHRQQLLESLTDIDKKVAFLVHKIPLLICMLDMHMRLSAQLPASMKRTATWNSSLSDLKNSLQLAILSSHRIVTLHLDRENITDSTTSTSTSTSNLAIESDDPVEQHRNHMSSRVITALLESLEVLCTDVGLHAMSRLFVSDELWKTIFHGWVREFESSIALKISSTATSTLASTVASTLSTSNEGGGVSMDAVASSGTIDPTTSNSNTSGGNNIFALKKALKTFHNLLDGFDGSKVD